jgi:hypothetical protein
VAGGPAGGDHEGVDAVVVAREGGRLVLHRPVDDWGDGYVWSLRVELHGDGLSAEGRCNLDGRGPEDLPGFLARLESRWRGWDGVLSWTAMDEALTLDATHHGHAVLLGVTLRRVDRTAEGVPEVWSARLGLAVLPGEELRNLARDAATVLARA